MAGDARDGHLSPAEVALIVLGEASGSRGRDPVGHLLGCPGCRTAVAMYRRAAAAGRTAVPDEPLVHPPARVWHRIRAALDADRRAAECGGGPAREAAHPDPAHRGAAPPADRPAPRPGSRWRHLLRSALVRLRPRR